MVEKSNGEDVVNNIDEVEDVNGGVEMKDNSEVELPIADDQNSADRECLNTWVDDTGIEHTVDGVMQVKEVDAIDDGKIDIVEEIAITEDIADGEEITEKIDCGIAPTTQNWDESALFSESETAESANMHETFEEEPITVPLESLGDVSIHVAITDPFGNSIVGGHTGEGRGFVMISDVIQNKCNAIAMDGCHDIRAIYLDVKDDDTYDIIMAGFDNENCVVVSRCDVDLNIINIVKLSNNPIPITMFTKVGDDFILGTAGILDDPNVILPIVAFLNNDLKAVKSVYVKPGAPEDFTLGEFVTGKVSQVGQLNGNLVITGSVISGDNAFGFVSIIDKDLQPVKSCSMFNVGYDYTSIEGLTIENDIITIIGNSRKVVDGEVKLINSVSHLDGDLQAIVIN